MKLLLGVVYWTLEVLDAMWSRGKSHNNDEANDGEQRENGGVAY